jgi:hypothetical protein
MFQFPVGPPILVASLVLVPLLPCWEKLPVLMLMVLAVVVEAVQ